MDYERFFRKRLGALRAEGRYRVFTDLERRCGRFPRAYDHRIGAKVTVWRSPGAGCSLGFADPTAGIPTPAPCRTIACGAEPGPVSPQPFCSQPSAGNLKSPGKCLNLGMRLA